MYFEILLFTLIIITIILIISLVYNNFINVNENTNNNNKILLEIEKVKEKNLQLENDIKSISSTESNLKSKNNIIVNPPALADPSIITELDYKVTFDPLTEPSRRPPRHVITPVIGNPYFNYPTRGFTDSYSLQGYLVKDSKMFNRKENTQINSLTDKGKPEEHIQEDKENKIIKLFGREKYPNSTEYEYYVIINTGMNDYIKYFLENQRKELYDGDSVYIDILKSKYTVKTLKNKTFEYNPYLI